MPFDPVDELLTDVTAQGGAWPPRRHRPAWRTVARWRAFLESDRDALARQAGWDNSRPYKLDPLGERIAEAWADYLYGDDPTITAANDADADLLEDLVDANELGDELRAAERRNAGEGEIWWRISVDPDLADYPLIEWHSRDVVLPLFIGRRLAAAALVTELSNRAGERGKVYRHLEIHAPGLVEHVLFRGTRSRIGETIDLDQHPETENLAERWAHALPSMLMGRIVNKRGRTVELGVSEYHGIRDYLLELNEALTIGGENMRLTAKKRIVAPHDSSALTPSVGHGKAGVDLIDRGDGVLLPAHTGATFAAGEDVLIANPLDNELGRTSDPFRVLEYSYDAEALIAHKRDLVEAAVTRVGLSAQAVGVGDTAGYAISGTAIRLRLIPTDKAGRGKARPWDKTLPQVLALAAAVDALPVEQGGFDRGWTAGTGPLPVDPPAVERANPLPADDVEDAQVDATLITAGARSARTSIRRQHPDWTDEQIADELEQIKADKAAAGTGLGLGGGF